MLPPALYKGLRKVKDESLVTSRQLKENERVQSQRPRLYRRAGKHATIAIILAMALLLIAKTLIAPAIIRHSIRGWLLEYWQGPIDIGSVDVSWGGAVRARNIKLFDDGMRQWMSTDWADFDINFTPRPSLFLTEAGGIDLRAHLDNGSLDPPLRLHPPGHGCARVLKLHELAVSIPLSHGALGLVGNRVILVHDGSRYNISVRRHDGRDDFVLTGEAQDHRDCDLQLKLTHPFGHGQLRELFRSLRMPLDVEAAGWVKASVRLSGQWDKPSGMFARGTIEFDGNVTLDRDALQHVLGDSPLWATMARGNLSLTCELDGKRLTIRNGKWTNRLCEMTIMDGGFVDLDTGDADLQFRWQANGLARIIPTLTDSEALNGEHHYRGNWRELPTSQAEGLNPPAPPAEARRAG